MIRGKFFATDDFDLAGHRLLNWRWLEDLPTDGAIDGQALILVDGVPTWTTITTTGGGGGPVDWADITGKPTVFPPDAHTHVWADITDKPTTFTPSTHTHPLSQLTQSGATAGQVATWNSTSSAWVPADPTAGPGGGVDSVSAGTGISVSTSVGDVTITCNLTWAELGNKPATFTPTAHTHSLSDLTQTGATAGQVVTWDSTASVWEPRTPVTPPTAIVGDTPLNGLADAYVTNGRGAGSDANVASAANRQIISPYIPTYTYTASSLGFRIASGAAAGTTGKVLIFDADADGRPTDLLYQSAPLATNAAAIVLDNSTTFTFSGGKIYWVGVWTSAAPTYTALAIGDCYVLGYSGASTAPFRSLVRSQAYGGTSTDWTYGTADLSTTAPIRNLFLKT